MKCRSRSRYGRQSFWASVGIDPINRRPSPGGRLGWAIPHGTIAGYTFALIQGWAKARLRRAHHSRSSTRWWARFRLRSLSYGGQVALPTLRRDSTFSRRDAPEVCSNIVPPREKRAQGKPGADCTRGPRATKSTGVGPQVNRNTSGFPCAMVYGLLRALVSRKSGRMCERAVLTQPPVAGSEPVSCVRPREPDGERGTDPVSSSTRTVAWASSPDRARKGAG